ncbi:YtpI-like protein [Paenibacillus taichungensis]
MFVMLLIGSLLLFSGLWYIIYLISKRTQNPNRSSAHVLRVILSISILVLIVENYIYATVPSNAILILVFIASLIATSPFFVKNKE